MDDFQLKTVWIVTGHSESGDDYGPVAFSYKPSDIELEDLACLWDGKDNEEGPGDYGSFVYLTVKETEITYA